MNLYALWSHLIALLGEGLNVAGATILAWDLLGRKREHNIGKTAAEFWERLRAAGSSIPVEDPTSAALQDAVRLGRRGCIVLLLGFLCLAVHHLMDIYEICCQPLTRTP